MTEEANKVYEYHQGNFTVSTNRFSIIGPGLLLKRMFDWRLNPKNSWTIMTRIVVYVRYDED